MAIVADLGVLKEILKHFPKRCNYAFAYGSAVFAQSQTHEQPKPGKMIDLVFVVNDPVEWHTENLSMNKSHYSKLRYFGAKTIASTQERMACGVYYNPYCKVGDLGTKVKYGVISTSTLEEDLRNWTHLYVAGRLQKPVLSLKQPSLGLEDAIRKNHQTALRAVLLQEGIQMTKRKLYEGICELSYLGDTRMLFAENPRKIANIVEPLIKEFDHIYAPLVNATGYAHFTEKGVVIQDISPAARFKLLMTLPVPLQISLAKQHCRDPRFYDIEDIMAELSYLPDLRLHIRAAISEIVRAASIRQTLQGVLTAGVFKSILYAKDKLKKGVEGRRKAPVPSLPSPPPSDTDDKQSNVSQTIKTEVIRDNISKAEKGKDLQLPPPK
ncbi:unnamed protein product [Orchesella dallaii]|uniref:Phosphatidate cytidylyltransferase, mitochondrial n=1 Tax=Orchesella dallaii TaxID=48710 RepID=A0ABP1Q766_9HEXA